MRIVDASSTRMASTFAPPITTSKFLPSNGWWRRVTVTRAGVDLVTYSVCDREPVRQHAALYVLAELLLDVARKRPLIVLARRVEQLVEVTAHNVEENCVLWAVTNVVTETVGCIEGRGTVDRVRGGHSRAQRTMCSATPGVW